MRSLHEHLKFFHCLNKQNISPSLLLLMHKYIWSSDMKQLFQNTALHCSDSCPNINHSFLEWSEEIMVQGPLGWNWRMVENLKKAIPHFKMFLHVIRFQILIQAHT